MGLKIQWAESAAEQFAERLDYIGGFNPEAAQAIRRKVTASLQRVSEFPDSGRWVPEFGPGFSREILVAPLRLLYECQEKAIVVTYVYRQEELIGPDTFLADDM